MVGAGAVAVALVVDSQQTTRPLRVVVFSKSKYCRMNADAAYWWKYTVIKPNTHRLILNKCRNNVENCPSSCSLPCCCFCSSPEVEEEELEDACTKPNDEKLGIVKKKTSATKKTAVCDDVKQLLLLLLLLLLLRLSSSSL